MIHYTTPNFWACYRSLPKEVQRTADKAFSLLKQNPKHAALRLKKIGPIWSARVGLHYRALGADDDGTITWFWIGTHADYDRLIAR